MNIIVFFSFFKSVYTGILLTFRFIKNFPLKLTTHKQRRMRNDSPAIKIVVIEHSGLCESKNRAVCSRLKFCDVSGEFKAP